MKRKKYKNEKINQTFGLWYNKFKDKSEKEVSDFIKRSGSNRNEAFARGYKNYRLSRNRVPYSKGSYLYSIYFAGSEVRKIHEKNNKKE